MHLCSILDVCVCLHSIVKHRFDPRRKREKKCLSTTFNRSSISCNWSFSMPVLMPGTARQHGNHGITSLFTLISPFSCVLITLAQNRNFNSCATCIEPSLFYNHKWSLPKLSTFHFYRSIRITTPSTRHCALQQGSSVCDLYHI